MTEQTKSGHARIRDYFDYNGEKPRKIKKIYAAHNARAYAVWLTDAQDKKEYCCIMTEDITGDFTEFTHCIADEADEMIAEFEKEEREWEKGNEH